MAESPCRTRTACNRRGGGLATDQIKDERFASVIRGLDRQEAESPWKYSHDSDRVPLRQRPMSYNSLLIGAVGVSGSITSLHAVQAPVASGPASGSITASDIVTASGSVTEAWAAALRFMRCFSLRSASRRRSVSLLIAMWSSTMFSRANWSLYRTAPVVVLPTALKVVERHQYPQVVDDRACAQAGRNLQIYVRDIGRVFFEIRYEWQKHPGDLQRRQRAQRICVNQILVVELAGRQRPLLGFVRGFRLAHDPLPCGVVAAIRKLLSLSGSAARARSALSSICHTDLWTARISASLVRRYCLPSQRGCPCLFPVWR